MEMNLFIYYHDWYQVEMRRYGEEVWGGGMGRRYGEEVWEEVWG